MALAMLHIAQHTASRVAKLAGSGVVVRHFVGVWRTRQERVMHRVNRKGLKREATSSLVHASRHTLVPLLWAREGSGVHVNGYMRLLTAAEHQARIMGFVFRQARAVRTAV